MMQKKINQKIDTKEIDGELTDYESQIHRYYSVKSKLMEEIDSLNPDDRHYMKRKADLDDRLYQMYDKIEGVENLLIETRAKKQAVETEKLAGDNIYRVQIYEERQENGQWLKSIKFKLPIIEEDMNFGLKYDTHMKSVCLLSKVQK